MQYASSDSLAMPSHLQLACLHELLLDVAEQLQTMLRMTRPEQALEQLIPPMEIKLAALAVADYLRGVSGTIETLVRERRHPAELGKAEDGEDEVAP